jgi:secreted trypsin-like serine protease
MFTLIASVQLAQAYANQRFKAPNADHQRMTERDLIIDGTEAISGRFPYMASLALFDSHKCGGTVSLQSFVLSSIHDTHTHTRCSLEEL